jgi:hypothetical protein
MTEQSAEVDASDRDRYEEACLIAARERVEIVRPTLQRFGRTITAVELEGEHPVTRLIVHWCELGSGRDNQIDLPVWGPELAGPGGGRLHPEIAAQFLLGDLEEPDV